MTTLGPPVTLGSELLRVLLVDERLDDVRRTRRLLESQGDFLVRGARSASEARRLLKRDSYDAVLVDGDLWTDDGVDIVTAVRETDPDAALVVIAGEDGAPPLADWVGAHGVLTRQRLRDGPHLAARIREAVERFRRAQRRDTIARWLERDAKTDRLTGLLTRAAFDNELARICARAARKKAGVALVLVGVEGTSTVNRSYGRDEGDAMIQRAAAAVVRCIRGIDTAGRIDGDTFGIIVAGGDLALAQEIARRISQHIDRMNLTGWQDEIPVTVSFGMAAGVAPEPEALLAAADAQLATHKKVRALPLPPRGGEDDGPSVA
ncbi:MAG: hypothetical protein Kow0010_02780 [Dehalococcoidia bacterium]